MSEKLIFVLVSVVLGILASIYAYKSRKYSISENEGYLRYRFMAVTILSAGFIVHSLGDLFTPSVEMSIESSAHVIIFVAFIFFIYASSDILKNAKHYWLK